MILRPKGQRLELMISRPLRLVVSSSSSSSSSRRRRRRRRSDKR